MAGFTADTTNLQSAAPRYDDHAQQVQQIYATLIGRLNAEGACWGGDETGKQFAEKYLPVLLSTLKQFGGVAGGLASTATGLSSWAKNYQDADGEALASANQISAV